MRRLLLPGALICALMMFTPTRPVSAGDPHTPGDDCPPESEVCTPPEGGGSQSAVFVVGDVLYVVIDGVTYAFPLYP